MDARRDLLVATEPSLILVSFANPQAELLDNLPPLAIDTDAPVVGTNMVFPQAGAPAPGGRSRFVAADGTTLWQAGTGDEMQTWELPLDLHRNRRPFVDAGDIKTVVLPQTDVELDGYATDDERPVNDLQTTWSVVDGPSGVTFADAGAPTTVATFETPGVYTLELRGDDGERSHSARTTVSVLPSNGDDPDWVAHWPFDGNLADQRLGHDGVASGNPTFSSDAAPLGGSNPQSLDLDGAGDLVSVADSDDLDFDSGFTISLWIKPRDYPGFFPAGNDWSAMLNKGTTWQQENYAIAFGPTTTCSEPDKG